MRGCKDYNDILFLKHINPPDFAVVDKYPLSAGGPPLHSKLKLCGERFIRIYILKVNHSP